MSDKINVVKMQQDWNPEPYPNQTFRITKIVDPNVEQYIPQGEWTSEQNMKYTNFLMQNAKFMEGKDIGKLWPIFKKMAKFVKTRNFVQCKSHHQKLLRKLQTIPHIIAYLTATPQGLHFNSFQKGANFNLGLNVSRKQAVHKIEQVNEPIFKPLVIQPLPIAGKQKLLPSTKEEYEEEQNKWHAQKNLQQMGMRPSLPSETSIGADCLAQKMDRTKEWLECHAIFLMWASKLSKLTSSSAH